jgi:predicted AAA+ superfamily ATPase
MLYYGAPEAIIYLTTLHFGSTYSKMQGYIPRKIESEVLSRLSTNPATALLGPRQCGKSTLAKELLKRFPGSVYLDLENTADLNKLSDPPLFFESNSERLVCIDEIQRKPELFPVFRSILDTGGRNGQLLLLGSASRDLIRQSSETLAGRISYVELTPFLLDEAGTSISEFWLRGGFPRSLLAGSDAIGSRWRTDFIRTFLERDIPQLGFAIPAESMRHLWTMCAHTHGQLLNASKIGESLGVSHHTIRKYIEILEQTFLLRSLKPYLPNTGKRLTKSSKIYIRDTGLLHALLDIETWNDLLGHPVRGASWEGMVIENIVAAMPGYRYSFYRTSSGAEVDLVLEKGRRRFVIECKASTAPAPGSGFWNALEDIEPEKTWIAAPVDEAYSIKKSVIVAPLAAIIEDLK